MNSLKKITLSVREILHSDIANLLSYWRECSDEDLKRLGECSRPDEQKNLDFLEWFCESSRSIHEAHEDILIWEVNSKAIGYSTLKQFKIPEYAQLHLHIWDKNVRGKGYGAVLFCMTALKFREKYKIKDLYCAPKWDNLMPNQMLCRIGFPIVESKDCIDWAHQNESIVIQNKYLLSAEIINSYLHSASNKFNLDFK